MGLNFGRISHPPSGYLGGMRLLPVAAALPLAACRAPPQAPRKLEELCGYIYDHIDDEEDEELAAGVENLDRWLGNHIEDALEGYTISRLDQEVVDALDDRDRSVKGLVGAAVATKSHFKVKPIVEAIILADQTEVFPVSYEVYDREFDVPPDCFPPRDCTFIEADLHAESSWAGLITVSSWARNQYRWVRIEAGWAMAQRSWMTRPADVSWDEIQVDAQYYLAVTLPTDEKARRLQATWIDADYGALPVGEDYAKQQIVTSMQNTSEQLEEWIGEN